MIGGKSSRGARRRIGRRRRRIIAGHDLERAGLNLQKSFGSSTRSSLTVTNVYEILEGHSRFCSERRRERVLSSSVVFLFLQNFGLAREKKEVQVDDV